MVETTAVVMGTSVLKEKGTVIMIAIVLQALFVVRTTVKGLTLTLQMTVVQKVELNASTMTRSTTRCSGDLMGDQIASGQPDRFWATRSLLGDQI